MKAREAGRGWGRWLTGGGIIACILVGACTGCSIRDNRLIRSWLYPATGGERTALGPEAAGAPFDHSAWSRVLADAVGEQGVVDYSVFQDRRAEVDAYVKAIGEVQLDRLS